MLAFGVDVQVSADDEHLLISVGIIVVQLCHPSEHLILFEGNSKQ